MRTQWSQAPAGSKKAPSLPIGRPSSLQHGSSGELVVTEIHSPGFIKNYRGRTFCVTSGATGTSAFDFSTGTYTAGLWNLKGSSVVAVPLKFTAAWTTLTGGVANNEVSCMGYAVCRNAGNQLAGGDTILSQFTAITPNDASIFGGSPPSPYQSKKAACAVINGQVGIVAHGTVSVLGGVDPSYSNCAAAPVAENKFAYCSNVFRGEMVIGPDNAIFFGSISGITAHLTYHFVLIWAEVPI